MVVQELRGGGIRSRPRCRCRDLGLTPSCEKAVLALGQQVGIWHFPERIRQLGSPPPVIREDLEVPPAVVAAALQSADQGREVNGSVAGKNTVCRAAGWFAPVAVLDGKDPGSVFLAVFEDVCGVPQVIEVVAEAN